MPASNNPSIDVDGLTESFKFLGRVDKELRKEAVNIIKKNTLKVKTEAQVKYLSGGAGVSRSGYPNATKTGIIHRASGKGASIGINRASARNPAIFPAEFGADMAMLPVFRGKGKPGGRRWVHQGRMRRRTFPIWRGNQFKPRGRSGPGWIVQPTIRRRLPKFDKQLAEDLMPVFDKAARRAGIPRG